MKGFLQDVLVGKEVEDGHEGTGRGFVDFRVMTVGAGDCCKLLVLEIEQSGKAGSGGCKTICFKIVVMAFGAAPVFMLH